MARTRIRVILSKEACKWATEKFYSLYDEVVAGDMMTQSPLIQIVWSKVWVKIQRNVGGRFSEC